MRSAWCFLVVLVAAQLGLSQEMGALIAGISLSTFPYNLDVIAKVISLRDFFITLFFVTLGTQIPRPTLDAASAPRSAASAFLVASRFVAIMPVLHVLRQRQPGEPAARHQPVADQRVLPGHLHARASASATSISGSWQSWCSRW